MRSIRVIAALVLGLGMAARADEFDRLEGRSLADLPGSESATKHDSLSVGAMMALPNVFKDSRSTLLVVKTDQGNLARMLVSLAFRKPRAGDGESKPAPILMVERFDTFEAGPATTRLARGRETALFDGFRLDLDTGQVVPDGQGGDVRFVGAEKPADNTVEAIDGAAIYTVSASPLREEPRPGQPSPGRTVLPGDFAGRYHFVANDQWTGRLDLTVDSEGVITGSLRSEESGNAYKVTGQVDANEPNLAYFSVEFPRSRLECAGRLFTEGKNAMAGTASLLERGYGFYAIREVEPEAPNPPESIVEAGTGVVVEVNAQGQFLLGGEALDGEALEERLRKETEGEEAPSVLIRSDPSVAYDRIHSLLDSIKRAGAEARLTIRRDRDDESP